MAVLFLARGVNGGIEAVDSFLTSYRAHPADTPHTLYFLAKGWEGVSGYDQLQVRAAGVGAHIIDLPDDGYDWGAYMRATKMIDDEWLCCLNTYSRIVADGWLSTLLEAATNLGNGYVGCSGSWSTIAPSRALWLKLIRQIWKTKGTYESLLRTGIITIEVLVNVTKLIRFPSFPNPHLRSNAFLLKRADFLDFCSNNRIPKTKADAWMLESGRQSLTKFQEKRGLSPLVIGKDKIAYHHRDWIKSNTFRTTGQHNLLISDNQTRTYDRAPSHSRRMMEITAWGESFDEKPSLSPSGPKS